MRASAVKYHNPITTHAKTLSKHAAKMHSSTSPSLDSCSSLNKIELNGQGHHVHEARVVNINEALQEIVKIKDIEPLRVLSHFYMLIELEGFHTLVPITYKKINHQHVVEHLV